MNDAKALLAAMLFSLAKLCRFNAFAGAFCGFAYGLIANLFDREFFGLGPVQITLIGGGCFVAFFALSIGLVTLGNGLLAAPTQVKTDSQA